MKKESANSGANDSTMLSSDDRTKLAQLKRVKSLATCVLFGCFVLMVAAKALAAQYPAFAFVAAFAEAATIGGIADWYAVVALFKKPLGLPIPHTAIIPANQERIGDNLGLFLERNFLSRDIVEERLRDVRFTKIVADHLSDRSRSQELATFIAGLMPRILAAVEDTGFKDFAAKKVSRRLEKVDLKPLTEQVLDSFLKDGRYQKLFDDLLVAMHGLLADEAALRTVQQQVARELPTLLYIFQADSLILKRIVRATGSLLDDVKNDPDHELRTEFEKFLLSYVERIKTSKRFAVRAERFKKEILNNPEITGIVDQLWKSLKTYVDRDTASEESVLVREMTAMFVEFSNQLKRDDSLQFRIDCMVAEALSTFVEERKSSVSAFVADEVKRWDFRQLVTLIEANVGKDLQYIRFNGMLIGGLVGLVLHTLEISLFSF
ncbi:MAG: DUF445 family protein [Ahrensia sp.]|nr:DUF445 family protein [Ahrensia sp.]